MPKYKATAYIRLSYTDDHSSESDSVSNQRKLIENFVERNPAVSRKVTGKPRRSVRNSRTSRVVPAIFVTSAISRWPMRFSRLDFPAFGGPIIATS